MPVQFEIRNMGSKTIEEELMQALKKIDVVNEEEFRKQQLINFQRAARTDKGVSAIRQVLNLYMSKSLYYSVGCRIILVIEIRVMLHFHTNS